MKCPTCGNEVRRDDSFCDECGARLKPAVPAVATQELQAWNIAVFQPGSLVGSLKYGAAAFHTDREELMGQENAAGMQGEVELYLISYRPSSDTSCVQYFTKQRLIWNGQEHKYDIGQDEGPGMFNTTVLESE